MNVLTLVWIASAFFLGFGIYFMPSLTRPLALLAGFFSLGYGLALGVQPEPVVLRLLDSFGVGLFLDSLTSFFIITNALVTIAVIFTLWESDKTPFFFTQILILHGSVNGAFASTDWISLYVALEVVGIAAFLLITYPRNERVIWVGLRYLLISNVAMLFYLVGAVLVYESHHSFDFVGLGEAPPEAVALLFLGLLVKGGIFTLGFWLPMTHATAEAPVSALLSGVVVKAAVLPLIRCALLVAAVEPLVRGVGVGTALLGVGFALFESDVKRVLAWSTTSQMGFILAAPEVGGFYALAHGLVKAALFLLAGQLPSRDVRELAQQGIPRTLGIPLALASFSISGFPLLAGFGAKVLTMKNLLPWQVGGMTGAAVGTAAIYASSFFLPWTRTPTSLPRGFWAAMAVLLGGLLVANGVYYEAFTWGNIVKPLGIIAGGWGLYWGVVRRLQVRLPRFLEQLEHLLGMMSVGLVVLFWLAWSW
ncbi:monovalent cation/H+ antiporter subunit D [Gloeomargarita lithophora Alchichica-D10]|uniref:Monovalent cation/H+ antiporter subunit D n=1 Tax=Gloeomargarita lithophora Alchichica-D10 TaxID=1188229 RepID=A0A1J0A9B9_9CYAN|nr:cation:proton antiporter [Gloeomargarita lithophora]APB32511.1 monovalent cation/H+ antiporter subunit D [Gloeomargarita lithophora Alchichica-D10]